MAGFFLISLFFFAAGFGGSLAVRSFYNKGPATNRLHYTLVITSVVCCWLMWSIVYMAQMKPLVVPIMKGAGE